MNQAGREQLVAALRAHGIHFLAGGDNITAKPTPLELIRGLALHADPRLRAALTCVFLVHPEWAIWVPRALGELEPAGIIELQARYMAAVYLQRLWRTRLKFYFKQFDQLPDLYSQALRLPAADERFGKTGLVALAEWHARQSPHAFNRLASYQRAADWLFGQLRAEMGSHEFAATG